MKTDVAVIGAGLSGLTAATLLARAGLSVVMIEQHYQPGGSCGAFRRGRRTFDQGATLLHGFDGTGFSPHRFLMDQLGEPITMVAPPTGPTLEYEGSQVTFSSSLEEYLSGLGKRFPADRDGIRRFYGYISRIYTQGIGNIPLHVSPAELPRRTLLKSFFRHPLLQAKVLLLLKKSAYDIMEPFFSSREVFRFFDTITSISCHTGLFETPALIAINLLMGLHHDRFCYPAGSTLQVAGKLEKAFEQDGGTILYQSTAESIIFGDNRPEGVSILTKAGESISVEADDIIHSGTLHDLYHRLLPPPYREAGIISWADALEMTPPSVILYCAVSSAVIPHGTGPLILIPGPRGRSITIRIPTLYDPSLCPGGEHLLVVSGPSAKPWPIPDDPAYDSDAYLSQKEQETDRLLRSLEPIFPGFREGLRWNSLATPTTIEYYTMKNGGCIAGPRQSSGQDLLHRHHASTSWENLFVCGEGTVMGAGTSSVTISGVSAANMVLRRRRMPGYTQATGKGSMVRILQPDELQVHKTGTGERTISPNNIEGPVGTRLHDLASTCLWCQDDTCRGRCPHHLDIRGMMRRLECGNLQGAKRLFGEGEPPCLTCDAPCEEQCLHRLEDGNSVRISEAVALLFS